MSRHLEHDYIGLTETTSAMERSSEEKVSSSSPPTESLNLQETELRLGLPGSKSPEKRFGVSLSGKGLGKEHVSGSKRGFSDANVGGSSGTGKWVFSASEVDLGKKGDVLEEGVDVDPQFCKTVQEEKGRGNAAPAAKAQVVGWPPIRSYRKNTMATNSTKTGDDPESKTRPECLYVKVSLDGAPYLRKVDLNICSNYMELSSALEKMFSCFTIGQCSPQGRDGLSKSRLMDLLHGSEYVLTYEDKDHDLMLVGDVPWEMFTNSCKRLRIMKGAEAMGIKIRN